MQQPLKHDPRRPPPAPHEPERAEQREDGVGHRQQEIDQKVPPGLGRVLGRSEAEQLAQRLRVAISGRAGGRCGGDRVGRCGCPSGEPVVGTHL
eukprot:scaffold34506_cov73-Isochrysis_galbana.AAC.1